MTAAPGSRLDLARSAVACRPRVGSRRAARPACADRAGAAADGDRPRPARSLAGRRAALRARGAGHAAQRRLAVSARRRRPVRRQAAALLLVDGGLDGPDRLVASRIPAAVAAGRDRHDAARLRPAAPRARPRGGAGRGVHAADHVPVRLAGAPGADRRRAVFHHDAEPVRAAAAPRARAPRPAGISRAGRRPASASSPRAWGSCRCWR